VRKGEVLGLNRGQYIRLSRGVYAYLVFGGGGDCSSRLGDCGKNRGQHQY